MSFQGNWGGKWSGDWLGAEATSGTETGARSLLAFWAGGAGSLTPVGGSTGYASLMAFWMGGGGYGAAADAIAPDWIVLARRRGRR